VQDPLLQWQRRIAIPGTLPRREPFAPGCDYPDESKGGVAVNEDPQHRSRVDELLALRCQLGERAAFDELIQRWAEPLRRYVLRSSGDVDAADDLVQEIWVAVVQGIAHLRDAARFRSWLFGIAHRTLMNRLRASYATVVDSATDVHDVAAQELSNDREESLRAVEQGLALLPLPERDVLTLFYLQELSLAEIASVMLVPVGTVKSRLFRARGLLRDRLIQKEITP
jgi:RNA polymerase sigma factor (sigma-70 family)